MNPGPTLHIIVPGECPPAPRPRFSLIPVRKFDVAIRSKSMKQLMGCFRPAPYRDEKHPYVGWKRFAARAMHAVRSSYCGDRPFVAKGAPVEVRILIVTELPKSKHRKTIEILRSWCVSLRRGDPDNLAKGPLDAAKEILWHDDTQVASLTLEKVVGEQGESPRMEMMVWPLRGEDASRTDFEQTREAIRNADDLHGPVEAGENQCPPVTENLPF